jgi:hypothetical protein
LDAILLIVSLEASTLVTPEKSWIPLHDGLAANKLLPAASPFNKLSSVRLPDQEYRRMLLTGSNSKEQPTILLAFAPCTNLHRILGAVVAALQ